MGRQYLSQNIQDGKEPSLQRSRMERLFRGKRNKRCKGPEEEKSLMCLRKRNMRETEMKGG